ncbi:MAG TPA: IS1595 family transposase [Candidatus Acidoferrum sp.]|nr:IS1595 family transposase [Candidatus Acidoferrum sp.]
MDDMNMNLAEMIQDFADESKCRAYLESLRWPNGVACPRCKAEKIYRLEKRDQFLCASCEYQFSVTVDTIFHDTHLPLVTWFLATFLLCEAKKGMSACQIQRSLGIKTYKTAWYLCHRIRAAMVEANKPKLNGVVEMDETYVGGRARGKRGRGAANKEVVIGIRQRQGELRFFHAEDVRSGTLERYIRENISDDVEILMTDDLSQYRGAARRAGHGQKHRRIMHKLGIYVQGDVHTNTVESAFSLLKRGVLGTWHRISAKHLQAYCNEMCFRFNNRKNPYLFRDTILKLIASPNLEYKKLTKEVAA